MSLYCYDISGYLGDVASTQGWVDLCAVVTTTTKSFRGNEVDSEGYAGRWVTMHGRHVFIREGEDAQNALWRSLGRENENQEKLGRTLSRIQADPRVVRAEFEVWERGDARDDPGVRDSKGKYTPAAEAENRHIAESFLDPAAKPLPGTTPTVVMMLGKPGAGKTTLLRTLDVPHSVVVNPDEVSARIPGYTHVTAGGFHERAADIVREHLLPQAIAGRYNLVLDTSGRSPTKMEGIASNLKSLGYHVVVVYAHIDTATSIERAHSRFLSGDRYMPVQALADPGYRTGPLQSYARLKESFADEWREYDTRQGQKQTDSGARPGVRQRLGGGIVVGHSERGSGFGQEGEGRFTEGRTTVLFEPGRAGRGEGQEVGFAYDPNEARDEQGRWTNEWGGTNPAAQDMKQYLDHMSKSMNRYVAASRVGWEHNSIEDFVLKNGQLFKTPTELPKGIRSAKMGLCFMNAYQLVDSRPELTYVEGFASVRGFPLAHAWAVDKQNNVIDPTWLGKGKAVVDPKETAYFGVKIPIDQVRATILARGKYGVLHNPEQGFPLLKEGMPTAVKKLSAQVNNILSQFIERGYTQDPAALAAALDGLLAREYAFDPNEPRDEHGRWTDAGAGGGSAVGAFSDKEVAEAAETKYKSRERLVEMPIKDFLRAAEQIKEGSSPIKAETVAGVISRGEKFKDLPFLQIEDKGNSTAEVFGHEGRHRAMALDQLGFKTMPVIIRASNIRWSEQSDSKLFDYRKVWPTKLLGQSGGTVAFPVSREEAPKNYSGAVKQHAQHDYAQLNPSVEMTIINLAELARTADGVLIVSDGVEEDGTVATFAEPQLDINKSADIWGKIGLVQGRAEDTIHALPPHVAVCSFCDQEARAVWRNKYACALHLDSLKMVAQQGVDYKQHSHTHVQLTAEETAHYAQVKKDLDAIEATSQAQLGAVFAKQRDAVLAKVKSVGVKAKLKALPHGDELRAAMLAAMRRAFDLGGKDADAEVMAQVKAHAGDEVWRTVLGRRVLISGGVKGLDKDWETKLGNFSEKNQKALQGLAKEVMTEFDIKGDKDVPFGLCAVTTVTMWDRLGMPKGTVPTSVMVGEDEHVILFNRKEGWAIDPTGRQYDLAFFKRWATDKTNTPYSQFHKLTIAELGDARKEAADLRLRIAKHSQHDYATTKPPSYDFSKGYAPQEALKWLNARSVWATGVTSDTLNTGMQQIIADSMKTGEDIKTTMDKLDALFAPYIGGKGRPIIKGAPRVQPEVVTPYRLENIVRTNTTAAYNGGRLNEFTKPKLARFVDGIKFLAVLDDRTTEVCRYMDGMVFHPDDADLDSLSPPLHFQCRSILSPVVVGMEVSPSDYITDAEVAMAMSLADQNFLAENAPGHFLDASDVHIDAPMKGVVVEPFKTCDACGTKTLCKQAQRCAKTKEFAEEQITDDEGHAGSWITMNGRHVFIRDGETPEAALERSLSEKYKPMARSVAQAMHFDPERIRFSTEDKEFVLNGMPMKYAGSANLQDGTITLYEKHLTPETIGGITAHEIGHQRFEAVLNASQVERETLMKDPMEHPKGIIKPDGTLREGLGLEKKYPLFAALQPYQDARWEELKNKDGVTDYSKAWWKEFEAGKASSKQAMHETFAEITRLEAQGTKLTGTVSPVWRGYYKAVNKAYKGLK